ncbi:hypothetical protein EYF80_058994 [Liparis tanakae]|uniref:Uncharacterized protein n=1 Tax=Liparis tanakae TaxID=230148 RepID=A0A4Z2EPY6_9TELE|nr:hypothetical protein EYF80_058994 [Liparis tanakae]
MTTRTASLQTLVLLQSSEDKRGDEESDHQDHVDPLSVNDFLHPYTQQRKWVSPSLLGVHVVDQLVPLVDQRHQLLEQQVLSAFMGLSLLPLCTPKTRERVKWLMWSEESGGV